MASEKSYPSSGGLHIVEGDVVRPMTDEESAAADLARANMTPEEMRARSTAPAAAPAAAPKKGV